MNINTKPIAKYKKLGPVTLFDAQTTKENLSELGNPLERLSQVIDFEMFRGALEDVFENRSKKNNAGAKPYDVVMMFKVMIIKHYYNLSDHQLIMNYFKRAFICCEPFGCSYIYNSNNW